MVKAAVLGAAGGIGQPLALLLKTSPAIDQLSLYDILDVVKGVAADVSHITSIADVTGHYDAKDDVVKEGLKQALTGADVVLIPAGIPRTPGTERDVLFGKNATIVRDLVKGIAENCPKAFILVISNPVNSTVPIAAEVMKQAKSLDPKRLFGVTTLDVVRAETFVQGITGEKGPAKTVIPVIGGHSGNTIVPLFSLAKPAVKIPQEKLAPLIKRVQFGGDEVVNAKGGAGSATLSMAYAGFRFAERLIKATQGEKGIIEPTFIYLPGVEGGDAIAKETGVDYFSVPVELGPSGAEKAINILGDVSSDEKQLLEACRTGLKTDIKKGTDFIQTSPPK